MKYNLSILLVNLLFICFGVLFSLLLLFYLFYLFFFWCCLCHDLIELARLIT